MLTSVETVPPPGALFSGLVLPIVDSDPDAPIVIRDIKGIGPVDAAVSTQAYDAITDGEYYIGSKRGKRNITMLLGVNDVDVGQPIIDLELAPKSLMLTFKFNFDNRESVYIDGWIESAPNDHFTDDPQVPVSIICPKPNFRSVEMTQTGVTGATPTEFEYGGNRNAGIVANLDIDDTALSGDILFEVQNAAFSFGYRHFELLDAIVSANKHLILSTIQGQKRIREEALAVDPISMLGYMSEDSYWLELWPGTNLFRVRTPDDATERNWVLTYTEQFGSI